jgi:glycosyltransferase involved in cell wall biosynthesis
LAESLTVLLPVHNAQAQLEGQVQKLLELLPELTSKFDVLIVDDGSTDATCEVAGELAARYPQLRCVRQRQRLGLAMAAEAALEQAEGDLVFVCHDEHGLGIDEIARVWHTRHEAIPSAKAWPRIAPLNGEPLAPALLTGKPHARADRAQLGAAAPRSKVMRRLRDFAFGE